MVYLRTTDHDKMLAASQFPGHLQKWVLNRKARRANHSDECNIVQRLRFSNKNIHVNLLYKTLSRSYAKQNFGKQILITLLTSENKIRIAEKSKVMVLPEEINLKSQSQYDIFKE